jgi:hypothetical protein
VTEALSKSDLLGARADGVFVDIIVGGRKFRVDYERALRFAVIIGGHAKIAKRNAGDQSTHAYGFANLTDARLDELKAQRARDSTAVFLR